MKTELVVEFVFPVWFKGNKTHLFLWIPKKAQLTFFLGLYVVKIEHEMKENVQIKKGSILNLHLHILNG